MQRVTSGAPCFRTEAISSLEKFLALVLRYVPQQATKPVQGHLADQLVDFGRPFTSPEPTHEQQVLLRKTTMGDSLLSSISLDIAQLEVS